jgi:peptide/nickel transport system ATP-binding protein
MTTETAAAPAATAPNGAPLLEVREIRKHFPGRSNGLFGRKGNPVKAVDGVSLTVHAGETIGLVGESGCGKSTTGRVIAKLIEPTAGSIVYQGKELANLRPGQMRPLRREIQMIFQDPYSSLNPRHTIGTIIGSPFHIQGTKPDGGVKKTVQGLMERVGLNPEHYNRYPHEFSGGQRQRIGIARALAVNPSFIVCDEAVSALDVSIQAQIINLLQDLQKEFNLTYLFIAHDLAVVRHLSDRIAVMYLGKVVETADRNDIYDHGQHPYTKALLSSIPVPDPAVERGRAPINLKGEIPSPVNPPSGCRFHTRCPIARAPGICSEQEPPLEPHGQPDQVAACHFAGEV